MPQAAAVPRPRQRALPSVPAPQQLDPPWQLGLLPLTPGCGVSGTPLPAQRPLSRAQWPHFELECSALSCLFWQSSRKWPERLNLMADDANNFEEAQPTRGSCCCCAVPGTGGRPSHMIMTAMCSDGPLWSSSGKGRQQVLLGWTGNRSREVAQLSLQSAVLSHLWLRPKPGMSCLVTCACSCSAMRWCTNAQLPVLAPKPW